MLTVHPYPHLLVPPAEAFVLEPQHAGACVVIKGGDVLAAIAPAEHSDRPSAAGVCGCALALRALDILSGEPAAATQGGTA